MYLDRLLKAEPVMDFNIQKHWQRLFTEILIVHWYQNFNDV